MSSGLCVWLPFDYKFRKIWEFSEDQIRAQRLNKSHSWAGQILFVSKWFPLSPLSQVNNGHTSSNQFSVCQEILLYCSCIGFVSQQSIVYLSRTPFVTWSSDGKRIFTGTQHFFEVFSEGNSWSDANLETHCTTIQFIKHENAWITRSEKHVQFRLCPNSFKFTALMIKSLGIEFVQIILRKWKTLMILACLKTVCRSLKKF